MKFLAEFNKLNREKERESRRKDFRVQGFWILAGFLRSLIKSYEFCGKGRNTTHIWKRTNQLKEGKAHEHR